MRNFLLVIITILIGLIFPTFILLWRINSVLLKPAPLVEVIQEQEIVGKLRKFAIDEYLNEEKMAQNKFTVIIPANVLRSAAEAIITETWLETQLIFLLREVYHLTTVGTKVQDVEATLQLSEPRTALQTEFQKLKNSLLTDFSSLPSCSYLQLQKMQEELTLSAGGEQEQNILGFINLSKKHNCWPTSFIESPEKLYNEITKQIPLEDIIKALPTEVNLLKVYLFSQDHSVIQNLEGRNLAAFFSYLNSPLKESEYKYFEEVNNYLSQMQIYLYWLRLINLLLLLILVGLLGIMIIISRKKIRRALTWLSVISIIFGGQLLFLNILGKINWLSLPFFADKFGQMPKPLVGVINDFTLLYLHLFFSPLFVMGIIFFLAGFSGIILHLSYDRKK